MSSTTLPVCPKTGSTSPASQSIFAYTLHRSGKSGMRPTHLRGARIVLRSKTPELVRQEFWGLMLAHYAIRALMYEAARQRGDDADGLSYVHAVRVIRRDIITHGAVPPLDAESSPADRCWMKSSMNASCRVATGARRAGSSER